MYDALKNLELRKGDLFRIGNRNIVYNNLLATYNELKDKVRYDYEAD